MRQTLRQTLPLLSASPAESRPADLTALLGEVRAAILRSLRDHGGRTASELARELGISHVAVRKHLSVLRRHGLVDAVRVRRHRGRPPARYVLTSQGRRLFPERYAELAGELVAFITERHGREELRDWLRWRMAREAEAYAAAVDADASLDERLAQLAAHLTACGFDASVERDGDGYRLTQRNCTIYEVARHHPEVCAYEAATFKQVLGEDVALSRRETLARGADACVCSITPRGGTS